MAIVILLFAILVTLGEKSASAGDKKTKEKKN
jgi:hypothetical protein